MNQTEKLLEALEKIANGAHPYNEKEAYIWIEVARNIAQQALESYKNGWVSVEERLPEPCSDVICFTLGGYGVESLLFDGDRKFYNQNTDVERNPTHWQPLPTPPQTKTI